MTDSVRQQSDNEVAVKKKKEVNGAVTDEQTQSEASLLGTALQCNAAQHNNINVILLITDYSCRSGLIILFLN